MTEIAIDAIQQPALRIIPLGGLGEIGMNLMVYEYGDAAIIVDCGMMFPDATTLGVDVIVPDMSYLFENGRSVSRPSFSRTGTKTTSAPFRFSSRS